MRTGNRMREAGEMLEIVKEEESESNAWLNYLLGRNNVLIIILKENDRLAKIEISELFPFWNGFRRHAVVGHAWRHHGTSCCKTIQLSEGGTRLWCYRLLVRLLKKSRHGRCHASGIKATVLQTGQSYECQRTLWRRGRDHQLDRIPCWKNY